MSDVQRWTLFTVRPLFNLQRSRVPLAKGGKAMTDERIAKARAWFRTCDPGTQEFGTECLDEVERLKALDTLATRKQLADLKELDVQDAHIRRLREALRRIHDKEEAPANRGDLNCPDCRLLAETEPR